MDIEQLIKDNDTEELQSVVKRYFNNDYDLFFEYITDEGYIENSNEINSLYEIFPKNIIEYWMKRDSEKMIDFIVTNHFSDVTKENEKYYMELDELSDLSFLFRSDTKSFAESILSQDYDPHYYSFSDFGMKTSDLISDLDKKSKIQMTDYINKSLGEFINYTGDDDTISSYVEEDGGNDSFKLTQERLEEIMGDNDSIASLLVDSSNFTDLGGTLANAYSDAYSNAESDAYYTKTINELKDFFETQDLGYWKTKEKFVWDKEGKRVSKPKDFYMVNITNILKEKIMDTVENNMSNLDEYNAFENLGSFEWVLKEYYEGDIRLYLDNVSPDYREVDTLFNEYFRDNI